MVQLVELVLTVTVLVSAQALEMKINNSAKMIGTFN